MTRNLKSSGHSRNSHGETKEDKGKEASPDDDDDDKEALKAKLIALQAELGKRLHLVLKMLFD